MDGQIRFESGYVWTWKFVSGKKKLQIKNYPHTCGRGLKAAKRESNVPNTRGHTVSPHATLGQCKEGMILVMLLCPSRSVTAVNR